MSIKIKQAITECLIRIENKNFVEETIRTLLIVSREYLKYNGLIKELAHFVAHPKRNQGLFHKKVNSRYAKLKLVDDQLLSEDILKIQDKIKNEEDLSDFMLGGTSTDKIESNLFQILYKDGLDDLPEEHLIKYSGLNKREAEKFLKENYTKEDGYYYLNVLKTEKMISLLKTLPKDNSEKERDLEYSIIAGKKLIKKIRNKVDSLQKIIRGTIYYSSVFDSSDLIDEFRSNFKIVLKEFNIKSKHIKTIENNIDEILLCLMTLLHDSTFKLYDNNIASVKLCSYLDNQVYNEKGKSISKKEAIYEFGVIALYTKYKYKGRSNSFPLYVSKISLKDYINKEEFFNKNISESISEIPWITAKRSGEKLQLETYS